MDTKLQLPDEVISDTLEVWKRNQKQRKRTAGIISKPKRRRRKNSKTLETQERIDIQKLPDEFLQDLDDEKSKEKSSFDESPNDSKRKRSKKLKFTSAVVDQDYIPLQNVNCATNFKLVQLDKNPTSFSTQKALEFYRKKLTRKGIPRESSKQFMRKKEKILAKNAIAVKRK